MKKFLRNPLIKIIIAWRIWLFTPILLASLILPFRKDSLFTTIWQYTEKYPIVSHQLIYPWSNFDGVHYLAIASRGYIDEGRFMPLYPMIIKATSYPFELFFSTQAYGGIYFWSGLVISHFFFFIAIFYLYKLLRLDYSDLTSKRTILLLTLFPTSFFFVSLYTESLFLFLTIFALYLSRKKKWIFSFITVALLSITRLPGILVIIPVLYEYLSYMKFNWRKVLSNKQSYLLLIVPIPLILYMIYNQHTWNDYLYFVHAHGNLGNSREVSNLVFPVITVYRYLKIFMTVSTSQYEFWVAVLEFVSLVISTLGIIFSFIKKIRPSYQLLTISLVSLPLLSGTLSGFPRYLILSFSIFLSLVLQIDKRKRLFQFILASSIIFQAILLMLFSQGWYVS